MRITAVVDKDKPLTGWYVNDQLLRYGGWFIDYKIGYNYKHIEFLCAGDLGEIELHKLYSDAKRYDYHLVLSSPGPSR